MSKLTLTASSIACALRCPRKYYYDNIIGLKVATPSEALRIGTAVHNGGEERANDAAGHDADEHEEDKGVIFQELFHRDDLHEGFFEISFAIVQRNTCK